MPGPDDALKLLVGRRIRQPGAQAKTEPGYRQPLLAFVWAQPRAFSRLRQDVEPTHLLPQDLLPGAHSLVSLSYISSQVTFWR